MSVAARRRLIAAAISACFASTPTWSNPTAPQVVNGSASFNQSGKLLTVSNGNGAIINWNTFSIGAGETTRFNQTSAASSVLNRVIANDPSVLLGTLSSNGRVWLVNPAGIMVGQGARVDVAGFVASTLNVRNEDFLAGRLNFGATPNAGRIENRGQITTTSGGSVYLVAPAIENHGIINAPNGEVILAAGQTVQLIDTGTPGVKVDITGVEGNVTNLGQIAAEAGRIGMAGVLVKNSGTLNASSLVKEGGRIFLKATGDAYVDGQGRIVTTGTKGGSIEVLGNRVALKDHAQLDSSGSAGGGTVLVGGDYQGKNPQIQNASITYFGPQASIKADATTNGDGGKVIVWADDTTRAYGSLSVRGGQHSGNGGLVETSGHRYLDVTGIQVAAGASQGHSGTWLLDPNDISITSGTGSALGGGGTQTFEPGTTSSITDGTINATLNGGTDVRIKTTAGRTGGSGDIVMLSAAAISTGSSGRKLRLEADRNIDLQGSIATTSTGPLSVELISGNVGASKVSNTISLNGGELKFSGGNLNLNTGASIIKASVTSSGALIVVVPGGKEATLDGVTLGGNLQVNPNGSLTIRNGLTLNSGKVYLGDGVTNVSSAMVWDGTQTIGGSGELAFNAPGGAQLLPSWHTTSPWTLTIGSGVTARSLVPGWYVIGSYGPMPDNVINKGALLANAGNLNIWPTGTFTNDGTLKATAGAIGFTKLIENAGIIQVDAGASIGTNDATLTNGASGVIKGGGDFFTGTWPTWGTLINNGTLSPGGASSPGKLSIAGNLINNGTIQTRIGGTAAGQYDVLSVTGNATLGGTLSASLVNGFAPVNHDFMPVVTASGTSSGNFSTLNLPSRFVAGYGVAANEAARLIYAAGAKTFTNAAGGLNWNDARNWTDLTLPGSTDDVLISAGHAVTHAIGTDTIGTLSINGGNSLSVSGGSLTVTGATTVGGILTASGGTVNLNGALANAGTLAVSAGTLNLGGNFTPANLGKVAGTGGAMRLTGTLTNSGSTLTLDNTTGSLDIVGTVTGGTLAVAGGSTSKYFITNGTLDGVTLGGNLQVNPNGSLTIRNGLTLNSGKVYLGDGVTNVSSAMVWDGTQTIGGSGELVFNAPGGAQLLPAWHTTSPWTLTIGSGVTARSLVPGWFVIGSYGPMPDNVVNNGTLLANAGNLNIWPTGTFANNGTLRAAAGAIGFTKLTDNAGIIQVDAGASIGTNDATFTNGASGVIKGSGDFFTGNWPAWGTLINNGTLSPGGASGPGKLSIAGNLVNNGVIQTRIGGTAAGQYDVLSVTGNATLGGTLSSALINGFSPGGQSFDVITPGSVSGSFATSILPSGFSGSIFDSAYRLKHTVTVVNSAAAQEVIASANSSIATLSSSISNSANTASIAAGATNSSAASSTAARSGSAATGSGGTQLAASLPGPGGQVQTLSVITANMAIGGSAGQFGGDPIATPGSAPAGSGTSGSGGSASAAANTFGGTASSGDSSSGGAAPASGDKQPSAEKAAQAGKTEAKTEEKKDDKKKDEEAPPRKQAEKPAPKKLATCS